MESTKHLELIHEFLQGWKIDQQLILFLYTCNEQLKSENKSSIYNSIKRIKYLGLNLAKEVHNYTLKTTKCC